MKNRLTPAVTAMYLLEESQPITQERVNVLTAMTLRSLQSALDVLTSIEKISLIRSTQLESTTISEWLAALGRELNFQMELQGEPLTLMLDRTLWTTAVRELLLNAKEHGNSKTVVSWSLAEKSEPQLTVRVRDFGPGLGTMAPDKAIEATRKHEGSSGSGMGLTKALWAAVLLDGGVELNAGPDGGVTAEVTGRCEKVVQ